MGFDAAGEVARAVATRHLVEGLPAQTLLNVNVPPARPQGIERNVVLTLWDWATPTAYMHDLISTDRRNPTVNANGPVYGALELSADYTPVLDPKTTTASRVPLTAPVSFEP